MLCEKRLNPPSQAAANCQSTRHVQVRTDLSDAHLYIFNRAALLRVLEVRPGFVSIKQVSRQGSLRSDAWTQPRRRYCQGLSAASQLCRAVPLHSSDGSSCSKDVKPTRADPSFVAASHHDASEVEYKQPDDVEPLRRT